MPSLKAICTFTWLLHIAALRRGHEDMTPKLAINSNVSGETQTIGGRKPSGVPAVNSDGHSLASNAARKTLTSLSRPFSKNGVSRIPAGRTPNHKPLTQQPGEGSTGRLSGAVNSAIKWVGNTVAAAVVGTVAVNELENKFGRMRVTKNNNRSLTTLQEDSEESSSESSSPPVQGPEPEPSSSPSSPTENSEVISESEDSSDVRLGVEMAFD